jgi:phosphoribosyl 1,2-cyclic phosphate phosphodiesterase
MKATVLGCGASLGTPAAGGFWGKCDPGEPRNHRSRAALLVQSETTNILVDVTVDLRSQLNRVNLKKIDGVLVSHSHSDHVNGVDDLKVISYHSNRLIDIYGNAETLEEMERRWPYLFRTTADGIYIAFLKPVRIGNYQRFSIGDIEIESFEQDHATCASLGFRFGKLAYSVDMADLNEKSLETLAGVETWIVDCAAYQKEAVLTHANIQRVRKWVDILKPKMTYLTVLTTHMDYRTLCDELPPHIRPAYDGMVIDTESNRR